jgi:hypothetical protein
MKENDLLTVFRVFIIILLIFCNYKSYEQPMSRNDSIKSIKENLIDGKLFVKPKTSLIREVNLNTDEDINEKGVGKKPKGTVYKVWRQLYTNCMSNPLIFADSLVYLGVSNQMGLGQLLTVDENKRINSCYASIVDSLKSPSDRKLVLQNGVSSSCSYNQSVKVGFDFLVKANLYKGIEGELNTAIGKSKTINTTVDSWHMDVINMKGYYQVLKESNSKFFNNYVLCLGEPDVYVITKVIMVKGFSAIITTDTDISIGLKAKLESGIIENVGDSNVQLKFTYVDSKTIKASTLGDFIVFAEVMKTNAIQK